MADQSSSPLGLPPSVWMVLIVSVAGAFAAHQRPFQDARPGNAAVPAYRHAPAEAQDIEARQWEDPFSAVAIARRGLLGEQSKPPAGHPAPSNAEDWRHTVRELAAEVGKLQQSHARVLVMGAMVPGAPYADDIETRRRIRYAVLAGLSYNGFVPEDNEHIGFITLPKYFVTVSRSDLVTQPPLEFAAYEWFRIESGKAGAEHFRVLVLWLDQDGFRAAPLARFASIVNDIAPDGDAARSESGASPAGPRVTSMILGPGDSDGLRDMNRELGDDGAGSCRPFTSPMRDLWIYSPRATASDWWIADDQRTRSSHGIEQFMLAKRFHARCDRVFLYRAVSSDFSVARALYKELHYRGIQNVDEIALVTERDTLYARLMSRYFNGCEGTPPMTGPTVGSKAELGDARPLCVTYLRGLDGLAPPAPDTEGSGSTSAEPKQAAPAPHAPEARETAAGQGQLDYLRRLATELASRRDDPGCGWIARQLKAAPNPALDPRCQRRIKAIGVIGSDIYDKLLVLQALRRAFPRYIFFTTDLDARLIDAQNLPWTRELVVGSSLGLSLRPQFQRSIPPFRDTYQTATYYSTLHAVQRYLDIEQPQRGDPLAVAGDPDADAQTRALTDFDWSIRPRIFEIGRTQTFDLTGGEEAGERCTSERTCVAIAELRAPPVWSRGSAGINTLAAGIGLAIAVAMTWAAMGGAWLRNLILIRPNFTSRMLPDLKFVLAVVLAIGIAILSGSAWAALVRALQSNGSRIPPPIFSGASQWAASLVEGLSILVVITLVIRGQRRLRLNAQTMLREFYFTKHVHSLVVWYRAQVAKGSWYEQLKERFWFPVRGLSGEVSRSQPLVIPYYLSDLEVLIAQYLYRGRWIARLLRVGLATVVATVALLVLEYGLMVFEFNLGVSLVNGFALVDTHYIERGIKDGISLANLLFIQFLIFWVADAMLLTRAFAVALASSKPAWPKRVLARHAAHLGLPDFWAERWLDLRLIAWRTGRVSTLIWYPSLIIVAMAVAAMTVEFGQFGFASNPIALIISAGFVVGAGVLLRRIAESWRADVLYELSNANLLALGTSQLTAGQLAQLDQLSKRVTALSDGAFAPYSQQPLVRAVLVPALTYGATSGLQFLHLAE